MKPYLSIKRKALPLIVSHSPSKIVCGISGSQTSTVYVFMTPSCAIRAHIERTKCLFS